MIFRIATLVAKKAAEQFPGNKEKADTAAAYAGLIALVAQLFLLVVAASALVYASIYIFEDPSDRLKRNVIESSTKEILYQEYALPGLKANESAARAALESASFAVADSLAKSIKAQACIDANSGTGYYQDCEFLTGSIAPKVESEKETKSVIDGLFPQANASSSNTGSTEAIPYRDDYLFINWGHGLHENGKWLDNGAKAPDGTPERALIMGIGDTVYNYALNNISLGATPLQVGRTPHTMADNIVFASKYAKDSNCGSMLYRAGGDPVCFLVSIHANLSDDVSKSGVVVYYNPYSERSIDFAKSVASCANGRALSDETHRFKRLGILRDVENTEGILIESGYMSNPMDLEAMKSGKRGSQIAKCVAQFFKTK
jgi:hypothetical protein